ncbi:MAG TPA: NADH:ubiquinone oxidoreductase [Lentisphaeria bacterium]|nr:MAG: hypothetical protein A2X47_03525 [Lentisphaerae bacterium GWF2_38_69]HBM15250.1 NADH:ubiquinone oxidoreductase [Lentisphaeria bacterium]
MANTLKIKYYNKKQFIPDIKKALPDKMHRGLPILDTEKCSQCGNCKTICPTAAIGQNPISIDLGKCIFCGDCERICKTGAIIFSNFNKLSSASREGLVITEKTTSEAFLPPAFKVRQEIKHIFKNSLKLRQVSAGGCNGCEFELNACSNANFDMGRFGIEFVASPRHADGLVITGPITRNMAPALEDAYHSTPNPKVVILTGACAISGGLFKDSTAIDRSFLQKYKIDLYIPGCPIHPLTFINAILCFIGRY